MKKNIKILDSAGNFNTMISLSAQFEKISKTEVKEWLPLYYAAFGLLNAAFDVKDDNKSDELTDHAIELIDKALAISPFESELYALRGYSYISKMSVKSNLRAITYLPMAKQALNKAKELNPVNPRPYYLLANIIYYTPKFYGGGKEKAMPMLKEALDKFNHFKPVNAIMPSWGKDECLDLMTR
jgi:tetratricopeptide (TPR) repeat protein